MRPRLTTFGLALALLLPRAAHSEAEVDRLELAALLLRDGQAARAAAVLAEIDPEAEEVDLRRYHTLAGLAALESKAFDQAVTHFEAAIAAGADEPELHLRLAGAHFQAGRYDEALGALDRAGERLAGHPAACLLRAHAHWRQGRLAEAYEALAAGARTHPDHPEIQKQQVLLLLELALFQQARASAERFLGRRGATADDYVLVAEALRKAGQVERAVQRLEEARLRFPDSERVAIALARAYADAGRPLSAGVVLQEASVRHPRLAVESAELFRRAGAHLRALHMNARVTDQKEKVRQRLGILIDMGAYERAAALEPRLERLGLLEDENIRYALAYAAFRIGDFDAAMRHLSGLSDASLFEKGIALRKAMDACRKSEAGCL